MTPQNPSAHPVRVLVVDDEAPVLEIVGRVLVAEGIVAATAESAAAALDMLEEGDFDLVLTDYWMKSGNGEELAETVKKRRPTVPIILMSGSRRFVTERGPIAFFLQKPFSPSDLMKLVRIALQPAGLS